MKTKTTNIIATLFIFLWLYTAASKIVGYNIFLAQLKMSNILGHVALLVSIIIPTIELIITGILLIGLYTQRNKLLKSGLIASAGLLGLFTIYISTMMLTNSHLPCTCGGFIQQLSWPEHLIFNIVMMVITMIGIVLIKGKNTPYRHREVRSDLRLGME